MLASLKDTRVGAKAGLQFTSFVDEGLFCGDHLPKNPCPGDFPCPTPGGCSALFPAGHQLWEGKVDLLGTSQQPLDSRAQAHKERGLVQF